MPNKTLISGLAGVISATALLSVLSGSILALPIFYIAPLPVYFVSLAIGVKGLLVAGASGVVISSLFGKALAIIPFIAACFIPALIVSLCLSKSEHLNGKGKQVNLAGTVIAYLAGSSAAALFIIFVLANMTGGLETLIISHLSQALSSMAPDLPQNIHDNTITSLAPFFPGVAAVSWIIMNAVNAAFAQWFAVRFRSNIRPTPQYTELQIPQWSSVVFIAACTLALLGAESWKYLGNNLILILALPFFFVGLAVVHKFLGQHKYKSTLIWIFYVLLIISSWASFVVALLGAIEQWFGLRLYFANQQTKE